VPKRNPIVLASGLIDQHYTEALNPQTIRIVKLFAALKKIREFERLQLPSLKSIVDFDILIEIGYAAERNHPLTFKQILLLNISSRTPVRRRLARLIEQGTVKRRKNASDQRSSLLTVSSSSIKALGKYRGVLASVCGSMD
jgi:DNA-binding MarR family transcriptional regulator